MFTPEGFVEPVHARKFITTHAAIFLQNGDILVVD